MEKTTYYFLQSINALEDVLSEMERKRIQHYEKEAAEKIIEDRDIDEVDSKVE